MLGLAASSSYHVHCSASLDHLKIDKEVLDVQINLKEMNQSYDDINLVSFGLMHWDHLERSERCPGFDRHALQGLLALFAGVPRVN